MSNSIILLSGRGQALIAKAPVGNSLIEIVGFLRRDGIKGIKLSTDELCAPVGDAVDLYSNDRERQ